MLQDLIFCDTLGGFDVHVVLSHLLQLGGFHEKLHWKSWKRRESKTSESKITLKKYIYKWLTLLSHVITLYLSPSPLEFRKYLLISWVRTDTGLLTFWRTTTTTTTTKSCKSTEVYFFISLKFCYSLFCSGRFVHLYVEIVQDGNKLLFFVRNDMAWKRKDKQFWILDFKKTVSLFKQEMVFKILKHSIKWCYLRKNHHRQQNKKQIKIQQQWQKDLSIRLSIGPLYLSWLSVYKSLTHL